MGRLPRNAQVYVVLIWIGGLLAVGGTRLFPPLLSRSAPWEILLLALLGVLAGRVKVRLMPRSVPEEISSLSLSFALIFATLLRSGPGAAMLVGAVTTLSSCLFPKRQPVHQILFNLGMNAVGTFLAGLTFLGVDGVTLALFQFRAFAAVMAATLVFFVVNTGTVAGAIALSAHKNLPRLWTETCLWTAPSYFASTAGGMLAVILFGPHLAFVVLCVLPVALLAHLAYAFSRRHSEAEHRHIQDLQVQQVRLTTALEREHRIAETLQRSLLSTCDADALPGLTVATQYEPAWNEARIGGDFYDTLRLPDGRVTLVVGDVTGKGLAAATHTAEVKFALRAFLHEHPHPSRALERLNDFLIRHAPSAGSPQNLVSVMVAVLDTETGRAEVGCAGAESPLLLRANGDAEPISSSGVPLGVLGGASYEAVPFQLDPGDSLLMATDGITEARAGRQFFGYEGLMRSAQNAGACDSVEQMGRAIVAEAKLFTGGTLQDDVCLLLARRGQAPTPRSGPDAATGDVGDQEFSRERRRRTGEEDPATGGHATSAGAGAEDDLEGRHRTRRHGDGAPTSRPAPRGCPSSATPSPT